ncbi:4286_t:CDS:2 [Entrophospora sp. SA101]|nr:4286_t:CDS:2 [Entrophospora sp. SA101]CAJ0912711.1 9444_t:CDS:2 [Entrophospora sp. SA101]
MKLIRDIYYHRDVVILNETNYFDVNGSIPIWQNSSCNIPDLPYLLGDYSTFIDIRRGPGIGYIVYDKKTNTQYINVIGCPNKSTFQYHYKSMNYSWAVWDQEKDGLFRMDENYVFLQCDDKANATMFRKEIKKIDATVNEKLENHTFPTTPGDPDHPSPLIDDVVMFLLDAETREKFKQEFTQVMEFFNNSEKYTGGTHKWFSMEKYNVLGWNSAPNKPYIYGGQSLPDIEGGSNANWLWDVYEEQGFVTAHSDGSCGGFVEPLDWDMGDMTHWYIEEKLRDGYKRIQPGYHQFPTDSICDNFNLIRETDEKTRFNESCVFLNGTNEMTWMQGYTFGSGPYCMGHKTVSQHTLDWVEEFLNVYKGKKRYVSATFLDTHIEGQLHMEFDRNIRSLIEKMIVGNKQTGEGPLLSKNSAIIIHSDHGLHYGSEYTFFEGYLHHKQPTMMMLLPNQLLDSHPNFGYALKKNQYRLTTHMDLHQTLLHLAYGGGGEKYMPKGSKTTTLVDYLEYEKYINNFLSNSTFRKSTNNPDAHDVKTKAQIYGQSFLTPMYGLRTCETLNIPREFCPCMDFQQIDYQNADQKKLVDTALYKATIYINQFLKNNQYDSVCQLFKYEGDNNQNNTMKFDGGFYNPHIWAEYELYRMTVSIKNFKALLSIQTTKNILLWTAPEDTSQIEIAQETRFADEWEKCRPRLRKKLNQSADKVEDEIEKVARQFCFCTNDFDS